MSRRSAILSIDPGVVSGWAVIECGFDPLLILSGKIHIEKVLPSAIVRELLEQEISIFTAVIEDQYMDKNVDSLKKLARSAGRWEEAAKSNGLSVTYIPAVSWQSKELGRKGRREQIKRLSRQKVKGIWGLELCEHQADAALMGRYHVLNMLHKKA